MIRFPGEVCDLKFSADEKWLAACGTGGLIRIYDTHNWTLIQTLAAHDMTVKSVAFTPDGSKLISGSRDDHIIFWNTETWTEQRRIKAHDTVQSISLSNNGRWLASGGADGRTRVWDVDSGDMVSDVHGHDQTVLATAISPNGRFIASGGYESHVCVWDRQSGIKIAIINSNSDQAWSLKFLANDTDLAIGTRYGDVHTYRVSESGDPQLIHSVNCHESPVRSIHVQENPPRLVTTSDDRRLCISAGAIGPLGLQKTVETARTIAFTPDSGTLAVGLQEGFIGVRQIGKKTAITNNSGRRGFVAGGVVSTCHISK